MELLQVMLDAVKGIPMENYTAGQTSEAIRNALVEANGGSTKVNLKTMYRGSKIYSLVEELIPTIIDEGFKDEDVIFSLVDYRNIADGDEQEFEIEGNSLFVVADAAAGIRGVRRQRIDKTQSVPVKTSMKLVRVYEELNRLLAGKIDFNKFVDNVAKSFKQQILGDAYKALDAISTDTIGLEEHDQLRRDGTVLPDGQARPRPVCRARQKIRGNFLFLKKFSRNRFQLPAARVR